MFGNDVLLWNFPGKSRLLENILKKNFDLKSFKIFSLKNGT